MADSGAENNTSEKMDVSIESGDGMVEITPDSGDQPVTVIELGMVGDPIQEDGMGGSGGNATVGVATVEAANSDAAQDEVATVDQIATAATAISQAPESTVTVSTWSSEGPEMSVSNDASTTAAVITLPADAVAGSGPTVPTSLPLTTVTISSTNRRPSASSPGKPSFRQWTFEEQFKQLYELSDEPERRQFLDALFEFMQRRGTPVNRIPIMAKTTLDLYKLFCEVVARGGLVEVINKKLWREVANSLNVPSSITSAAFTLRTQYIKYLYPYECETKHLSSPEELHMAVDVNRRDARTPVGGTPQTPGTPHTPLSGTPVRLLMDPNQASPLSLSTQPTPNATTSVVHAAVNEPAAKKPRIAPTMAAPTISASAMQAATITALPTPYCNIRISHATADASGNVQELPPSEAAASDGSTIFVSMEINGLLYQGFLCVRQPLITVQPTAATVAASGATLVTTPHTSS